MTGRIRIAALAAAAVVASAGVITAQVPQVRISQAAEVEQTVGLADVHVKYHRPGVKGRTIWGGLLKYGEVWRAGANEPTLITFSHDVTVAGTSLKAGTYRYVVIPKETGPWDVIFNSEVKNWGTVYDASYDVARIPVTPRTTSHEEWMSFSFTDLSGTAATLVHRWEKVALDVPLTFNTEAIFEAAARSVEADVWRTKNGYARYLIEYGNDPAKAMKAADEALALSKNAATLRTKAEALAGMGKYADAIKMMEEAIKTAKEANPSANTSFLQDYITNWKNAKK